MVAIGLPLAAVLLLWLSGRDDRGGTSRQEHSASSGAVQTAEVELRQAVLHQDVVTLRSLLDDGADPNARDAESGGTALHYAVTKRRPDESTLATVRELLTHGADPSIRNMQGVTPLAEAVLNGSETLVQELIAAGGDPNQVTPKGLSLLVIAEMRGNEGAATAIRSAGGVYGDTPKERGLVRQLPKVTAFLQEARELSRDRKFLRDGSRDLEHEAALIEAYREHFDLSDGDAPLEDFKLRLQTRSQQGGCSSCDNN